jgi:hypothetical protein
MAVTSASNAAQYLEQSRLRLEGARREEAARQDHEVEMLQAEARRAGSGKQDLLAGWDHFLEDLLPWTWMVHLGYLPNFPSLQVSAEDVKRWIKWLRRQIGHPRLPWYFFVPESQVRGAIHWHGLVCLGAKSVDPMEAKSAWEHMIRKDSMGRWASIRGDAKIERFVPGLGGAGYQVKRLEEECLVNLPGSP